MSRAGALLTFAYLSSFSSVQSICNTFWLLGNTLHCAGEWVGFVVWFILSSSISWSSSSIKTDFGDQTHLRSSSFWNRWFLTCSSTGLGSVTRSQTALWASAWTEREPCHVNICDSSVPWKESQAQLLLVFVFCKHLCQYKTIAPMFMESKGTGSAKTDAIHFQMQINISGGKKKQTKNVIYPSSSTGILKSK